MVGSLTKIISSDGGAFYDELSPELQSRLEAAFRFAPVHPGCGVDSGLVNADLRLLPTLFKV